MRDIYLDHNATTPVAPEVREAMLPFLGGSFGNPSSMHRHGREARRAVDAARAQVARFLNASPAEIVFTSGGTEGNNLALRGCGVLDGPRRVVTTAVEHPAVLEPFRRAEKGGTPVTWLRVDGDGRLDEDGLTAALREGPSLISAMWANNETGVVFPVGVLAVRAKAAGCLVHSDAVQAAGRLPLDMRKVPVDYLALSGHKLYAPKGVGALFVRRGAPLEALQPGGGQEGGRRGGTENVASIVGFGVACELAGRHMADAVARMARLRDRLAAGILAACPGAMVTGRAVERLCNTLHVSFAGVEAESALLELDRLGIAVSLGSACATGSMHVSHVLRAMGFTTARARSSLRFSLGRMNDDEDIDTVLRHLPELVNAER